RVARRTNLICLTLFVVVIAGVVAAFFITDRQRAEVREHQQQINREYQEAARYIEEVEKIKAQEKEMLRKAKITNALVERIPRTLIIAEMVNHMPSTLSLLEFDMETTVVKTASRPKTAIERKKKERKQLTDKKEEVEPEVNLPVTQVSMSVIGLAPTDLEVSQFIASLNRHELFQDVTLQFIEEQRIDDQKMRKFRMLMKLNQDVNVQEMEPTRVARGLKTDPLSDTLQIDDAGQFVMPEMVEVNPQTEE
ncbi:MAG: PilN domain-containing protein, partial [Rhodospirillales bacterium]|nr:PilN domain-containing protein [Rhodospirillales bacterium]